MPAMAKSKAPASESKKTASDKKGESAKKKAPPPAKASAAAPNAAPKAELVPAVPPTSAAIAGPGSEAVLDKKPPRFKANPPRNPFSGAKNPRLNRP